MQKKQLIYRKPAYENGQLLMADDFIREQQYHAHALHRHSLQLHGWGVVRGLEVTRASDTSVSVGSGLAVDGRGREIELQKSEQLEVQGSQSSTLAVTIGYRTERPEKGGERDKDVDCYALLRLSSGIEEHDVVLANVQLDDRGRIVPQGITTANRRWLRTLLAPGSVGVEALEEPLRRGWLRLPFRPTEIPQDQPGAPPPFRVGPTETVANEKLGTETNTKGAGGTMAITLPPQARYVHKLRVAGRANAGTITIELFKAGWDSTRMEHYRKWLDEQRRQAKDDWSKVLKQRQESPHVAISLLKREITTPAYDETYDIPQEHGEFDMEGSTLSLRLLSSAYAAVSLIAVQVSY